MGRFSYLCKKTGEGIKSSSFSGDAVYMFLLHKGEVIEEMMGNYDSYGTVFKPNKDESFKWEVDWGKIVDLHFNSDNTSGIAAIRADVYDGTKPTTISESDSNQGWGSEGDEECLFTSTNPNYAEWVDEPYHKVYRNVTDDFIGRDVETAIENYATVLNLKP